MATRGAEARLTDEQKEKRSALQAEARRQNQLLTDSVRRAFSTDDGRMALRYLMGLCGYQKPGTVANPQTGEVLTTSLIHNEAQLIVYLKIRAHIPARILAMVENQGLEIDEEIEDLLS